MDQARMKQEMDRSAADVRTLADARDAELRTLDELELMLAGGGDGGPNWP